MKSQIYPVNQSPLYAIKSKAKLAKVLLIEKSLLLDVSKKAEDGYKQWSLKPRKRDVIVGLDNKKSRNISEPKGRLKDIHNRLSTLLSRIEKPDFVNSATKGRSYECNAIVHQKRFSEKSLKIDIKNFYPSVKKISR